MAQFVVANNVNTQLAAALPASGAGSTTVTLASSANLPTLNTAIGQMMPLTLNDAATGAIYEVVYATAISGATLTVLRGQEGSSALNWSLGDLAFCAPTAGTTGLATMRTQYQASASFSSSQTLTAAIAGESIGFTGASAATFSIPGQSTVPALTPTAVYNDGTAALTLTANGSDKFVVATGQVTSIVMQPGDDLTFYASTTAGLWTAASGSALRQYEPLVIGTATQPAHAVQFSQLATVQGAAKNLAASTTGLSAVVTLTADELVLESAAHLYVTLRGVNLTASTGAASGAANSLDTGAWAQSTWYARHVIYNPTTSTAALLWSLSRTAPTLPSGYTFWAFTGWERTQSATNFNPLGMNQFWLRSSYVVNPSGNVPTLPIMSAGAVGSPTTPTNLPVAWAAFAPPDTSALDLFVRAGTAGTAAICSPNNNYGPVLNTAGLAPPISFATPGSQACVLGVREMMQVESANVFYANNDATFGILQCAGFQIRG